MIIVTSSFSKRSVFKRFLSLTQKREAGVFKFVRFGERFRISVGKGVGGRPNRRNKAAFFFFSLRVRFP